MDLVLKFDHFFTLFTKYSWNLILTFRCTGLFLHLITQDKGFLQQIDQNCRSRSFPIFWKWKYLQCWHNCLSEGMQALCCREVSIFNNTATEENSVWSSIAKVWCIYNHLSSKDRWFLIINILNMRVRHHSIKYLLLLFQNRWYSSTKPSPYIPKTTQPLSLHPPFDPFLNERVLTPLELTNLTSSYPLGMMNKSRQEFDTFLWLSSSSKSLSQSGYCSIQMDMTHRMGSRWDSYDKRLDLQCKAILFC